MTRSIVRLALIGLAASALLTGCGRKGPLELPPSAQVAEPSSTAVNQPASLGQSLLGPLDQPQSTTTPAKPLPAMDRFGQPMAPPGPKKHIFLDNLID